MTTRPYEHKKATLLNQVKSVSCRSQSWQLLFSPTQLNIFKASLVHSLTHKNFFLLREDDWCIDFIKCEVVEGYAESQLLRLLAARVVRVCEFFECEAFAEVKLVDVDQLHLDLTIALSGILKI